MFHSEKILQARELRIFVRMYVCKLYAKRQILSHIFYVPLFSHVVLVIVVVE